MKRVTTLTLDEPEALLMAHGVLIISGIIHNLPEVYEAAAREAARALVLGLYSKADVEMLRSKIDKLATEWEKPS